MITLHRLNTEYPTEDRIAFPASDIRQIHEGKGGVTIVVTPLGKLAVREGFDEVVKAVEKERENAADPR